MGVYSPIPTATHELAPVPGERLVGPFARFAHLSSASGILLFICTIVALVWVNAGGWESYHHIFHVLNVHIGIGGWHLGHGHLTLGHFINDALMAVFFLLVGLEIKRELIVGELSDLRKAALPVAGAIGGMLVPALIFVALNLAGTGLRGWGVPMATDIAFALGILALLGSRVPNSLRIFLTTLAIADDIGALLVIALFYTEKIQWAYLGYAGMLVVLLIALNRSGFKRSIWFLVPGVFLWYCFFESGVHATIAGVLLAATIPVNPRVDRRRYVDYTRTALDIFERNNDPTQDIRTNATQRAAVMTINQNCRLVLPTLHRMEDGLHGWVAFIIIPIFALANAGVYIEGSVTQLALTPVSLGVILGLFIGKPLGITLVSWLACRTGLARLPADVSWRHILGAGCLGGIGFTMSMFIALLGYKDAPDHLTEAKLGILIAAVLSAICGLAVLLTCPNRPPKPRGERLADDFTTIRK